MPSRLLVIGLDAADPALVRDLVARGELPALARLIEHGTSGTVAGVEGFFVGSTWPTLVTGLGPAGHGFQRIEQLEPGTYRTHRLLDDPAGIGGTPFWKTAALAGCRVCVLDVPFGRLDPGCDAVQLAGWGGVDRVFPLSSLPPSLAGEALRVGGPYPDGTLCDRLLVTPEDFAGFADALEREVEGGTRLSLDLLGREPWDLLLAVFTEAHCAGHLAWHLHDAAHPAHDPELRAAAGDPVERVYRALDRAVGQLVEAAGDARVVVLSAHGMTGYHGALFLLAEILYRLGATVRPAPVSPPLGLRVARAGWNALPGPLRRALDPLRPGAGERAERPGAADFRQVADMRRSLCFPVPNGSPVSAIRLNLRGREPDGQLEPGAAADAFCERLAADLLEIVDERTGAPLVARVRRTRDVHRGPRLDRLPDLLVEWSDAALTGTAVHAGGRGAAVRVTSPRIGTVEGRNAYNRTGDHRPLGMLVAAGAGQPAGSLARPVSVVDLAPTFLGLLGVPAAGLDGAAVSELSVPLR